MDGFLSGLIAGLIFIGLAGLSLLAILILAITDQLKNKKPYSGYIISAFIPFIVGLEFSFADAIELTTFVFTILIIAILYFILARSWVVNKNLYWKRCSLIFFVPVIIEFAGWFILKEPGNLINFMTLLMAIVIVAIVIMNRIKNEDLYSRYMFAAFISFIIALTGCLTIDYLNVEAQEALDDWGAICISIVSIFLSFRVSIREWRKINKEDMTKLSAMYESIEESKEN